MHIAGCLSVVGYQGRVKRARRVRIAGWNEKGEDITWEASDWPARILQHEYDHLQGTLYVDRMDPTSFTAKEHMPAAIEQQLKSLS
jgi:peptide deformylase